MVCWAVILTGVAIALAIYQYFSRILKHFEKTGVPHVKPRLLVGNMGAMVFRRRSMADHVKWIYDRIPDAKYIGFHDFTIPTIMLRDPEIIKYITVKNFDNFVNHTAFLDDELDPFFSKNLFGLQNNKWREMRTILSPAFTSSKIKGMYQLVAGCGTNFSDNLGTETRVIDLKDKFTRYTMDVIASAAFGISVDSLKDPNNEFYLMGKEATTFDAARTLKFFLIKVAPWLMKLLKVRVITENIVRFFTHIVRSTVASREALGQSRNDMIQLMMEAKSSGKAPNLSINDMTAQAFVFFFAGFETTATAMSFAAHELAINPEIQDKLQAEIDAVRSTLEGELTWEVFQGMHYLEAVINETLRKYPPAVVTDRVCNKAIEIPPALPGAPPFTVQPGSVVWIPYFGLHRDPRWFENPEHFDPERFIDPSTGKNREPLGFMPFGNGPRFCIGQRFAMMEVKLAIFHLLAKYRLQPCAKTTIPMTLSKGDFNLKPEHGFWVEISPRN